MFLLEYGKENRKDTDYVCSMQTLRSKILDQVKFIITEDFYGYNHAMFVYDFTEYFYCFIIFLVLIN